MVKVEDYIIKICNQEIILDRRVLFYIELQDKLIVLVNWLSKAYYVRENPKRYTEPLPEERGHRA